jgi:hypothetical protein
LFAAAAALILAGVGGWTNSATGALESKAAAPIIQVDTLQMMVNAKDLPIQEFEDFSVVFSSPLADGRTSITP